MNRAFSFSFPATVAYTPNLPVDAVQATQTLTPPEDGYKSSARTWFLIVAVANKIGLDRVGCTVLNTVISVPMGNFSQTGFFGIGPSAASANLPILVNCIAGTQVSMTIAGTADASGTAGVLALNPSASPPVAQSVALHVLFKGMPITLCITFSVTAAAPDGDMLIPMTARFYPAAAQIVPGHANSTTTFTLTYN